MPKLPLALIGLNTQCRTYSTPASIQEWISKTTAQGLTEHHDTLDPLRASHLLRTLPTRQSQLSSSPSLRNGDELMKGGSMIYFQPETMLNDLGADGSSTEYNAPHPYTRRMWAGGSFTWPKKGNRTLRIGNKVIERRNIAKVEYKVKGDMIFINQSRITYNKGSEDEEDMWGVKEVRTHVFRPPSPTLMPSPFPSSSSSASSSPSYSSSSTTSPTPTTTTTTKSTATTKRNPKSDISFTYTPTTPLLFRYSALTFNAHKIHYDIAHTTSTENQPTLLVHGPLTATLLIDLAVTAGDELGKELVGIEYRAVGPIFVDSPVEMVGWWIDMGLELEARQGERVGMRATASFA